MIRFINKFKERTVTDFLTYKLKSTSYFHKSYDYVRNNLVSNPVKDLNDCTFNEGKNYDYYLIEDNDVSLIIRRYQLHFTLYMKHDKSVDVEGYSFEKNKYTIATFKVDRDKRSQESDDYFLELNKAMPQLIELIRNDEAHTIWNSYCFEVDKSVEVKVVLDEGSISEIDLYVFALEELFRLHFEFFAQREMMKKLSDLKVGDNFGLTGVITRICNEIDEDEEDVYYHGYGLEYADKDGKKKFEDVYSLSRWYYDEIYGKQKTKTQRQFRMEYNGKTIGITYQKGVMFLYNKHEIDGKTIYSSSENIEDVKAVLKYDFLDPELVSIQDEVIILED